jgi:hypothetical protein
MAKYRPGWCFNQQVYRPGWCPHQPESQECPASPSTTEQKLFESEQPKTKILNHLLEFQ